VQDAWRAYHEGRFEEAVALGTAMVASGSCGSIRRDDLRPLPRARRGQEGHDLRNGDGTRRARDRGVPANANAFYMLAVSQGRYSQFISMIEALSKGMPEDPRRGGALP